MINKTAEAHMQIITISSDPVDEFIINATAREDSGPGEMLQRVFDRLNETGAVPVAQRVFAGHDRDALRDVCGEVRWPVTWLTRDSNSAPPTTQVCAIRGASVDHIERGGKPVASVFEKASSRWCRIGEVVPQDGSLSAEEQARGTLEQIVSVLEEAGMEIDSLARTWFFLNDILSWYGPFNKVRNDFFTQHGVFDGLIPASTGIGISNADGRALAAEALVVECDSTEDRPRAVASPAQCAATNYGSSFSRAVEVTDQNHRRVYISGTASLDSEGRTIRKEDFKGQLEVTLKAVEKILNSRDMDWGDTVRAISYAPRPQDMPALEQKMKLLDLPVSLVPAVVCRDDLLFELEMDAARDLSAEPTEKGQDVESQAFSNL